MSQNDQTAVNYVVELWTDINPNVSTSSLKGNFLLDAFNAELSPRGGADHKDRCWTLVCWLNPDDDRFEHICLTKLQV